MKNNVSELPDLGLQDHVCDGPNAAAVLIDDVDLAHAVDKERTVRGV